MKKDSKTIPGLYKYKLDILDTITLHLYFKKLKPGERSLPRKLIKKLCSISQIIYIYGDCSEEKFRAIKEMSGNVELHRRDL